MSPALPQRRRAKLNRNKINLSIGWFWDGGINVRLGDEIGGSMAEENVAAVADIIPWLQEAIAHFYPGSSYAASPSPEIRERAKLRLFLPPRIGASAICRLAARRMRCREPMS